MIFVFGSNTAGIHGAGAARVAYEKHGAVIGCGYGHMGNSFAIPTKDRFIAKTLTMASIQCYVNGFIAYALDRPDLEFQVTRIGCGLAGLKDEDVAPMFQFAPKNCYFDNKWIPYLEADARFWGTY